MSILLCPCLIPNMFNAKNIFILRLFFSHLLQMETFTAITFISSRVVGGNAKFVRRKINANLTWYIMLIRNTYLQVMCVPSANMLTKLRILEGNTLLKSMKQTFLLRSSRIWLFTLFRAYFSFKIGGGKINLVPHFMSETSHTPVR